MIMTVAHGHLCLVRGLLSLKGRIDLDRFIATVEFTHMAFHTKTCIGGTRLLLFTHRLHLQHLNRTHLYAGPTTYTLFFIYPYFNLNDIICTYFWHRTILL